MSNTSTSTTAPVVYFDKITGPTAVDAPPLQRLSNVPSLVCAFSASVTTGGTIYAFGIYGDALKKSLNLSQLQLDAISATFFIAGLFSWMPGLVVDRFGMRVSMCLGGVAGATFVLLYWTIARQFITVGSHVVVVLSLLAVCICLSCGLIIGSIFKLTLLCGGPGTRGSAVGVAKGFVGLGAGVYATIFQALRTTHESALNFLPVIAFFFILCAALPAYLLLPTKAQTSPDLILIETTPLHFRTLFVSLFILATVIVASAITDIIDQDDPSALSHTTRDYNKVTMIILLWLGPIISVLYLPRNLEDPEPFSERGKLPESRSFDAMNAMALDDEETQTNDENKALISNTYQHDSPPLADPALLEEHDRAELNLTQMLRTPSAWLMLWTTTILVGSGTYKTNNMGEMVEALGFADSLTPATLAIFSVAQAGARIVTGVVSEAALHWNVRNCCVNYGVPRPFFLVVASSIAVVAHVMLVFSTTEVAFVIGCTISGIAFGMAWPLMVLIVGDIFGLENHGANYMFYDGFTKAIGTIFLSTYVAGNVYEAHVETDVGDGLSCFGPSCFRMTHLTVAVLALSCVASSLVLQFMSRRVYNKAHRA